MKLPPFLSRISAAFGESLANRLRHSLHYPSLLIFAGIAVLFGVGWGSIALWMAVRETSEWSSSGVSLAISGIFILIGLSFYLVRRNRIRNPKYRKKEKLMDIGKTGMKTEQIEDKSKELLQAIESKAEDASILVKRGANQIAGWIRENPVQATFVGAASGLVVGVVARHLFAEGKSA